MSDIKVAVKPKKMVDFANDMVETGDGTIIFINNNHRLTNELNYQIRVVCMEDFVHITNSDEYIGFIYGIISADHDIQTVFIDSILKHADFKLSDLPNFLARLEQISKEYELDFIVSISAEKEEMIGVDLSNYEILN